MDESASIEPGGDGTGTLTFGSWDATDGATLQIQIAGQMDHDLLAVSNAVVLGGDLVVTPIQMFAPNIGQKWDVVTADVIVGKFDNVTGTAAVGTEWKVNYFADRVEVELIAVPVAVNVTATVPTAEEDGSSPPGEFTFTRDGALVGDLTVHFSVTGTASQGLDYESLGGSVVIIDGQASSTVDVTPYFDMEPEGDETVVVTITADPAYTIGSPSSGTVTIIDGPQFLTANVSGPGTSGPALTVSDLDPVLEEAARRWSAVRDDAPGVLSTVDVSIVNLPGNRLGAASGSRILIDADAAGHGWFVDATPHSDTEYLALPGQELIASLEPARQRMDLLTVVMHEMGHVLGLPDLDPILVLAVNVLLDTQAESTPRLVLAGQVAVTDRRYPDGIDAPVPVQEPPAAAAASELLERLANPDPAPGPPAESLPLLGRDHHLTLDAAGQMRLVSAI